MFRRCRQNLSAEAVTTKARELRTASAIALRLITKSDHRRRHRTIAGTAIQAVQTKIVTLERLDRCTPGLAMHQRPEAEK